ncbi:MULTISPECIES: DLW-39 family protein [Propionimicrobium]|nr:MULTISPECIES: DLW-39 family protein [Propionimicrobium]
MSRRLLAFLSVVGLAISAVIFASRRRRAYEAALWSSATDPLP